MEPEGQLKISVFESFGHLHLCTVLAEFLQLYPKVSISIELENKMVDLISEEVDIAIRIGVPQDSQLKARTLLPDHTLVCASPAYVEKMGAPSTPEDLKAHNCLLLNRERQRIYWYFRQGRQKKKILVQGNLYSKGGTPLLTAALQAAGIVQISNWMASEHVRRGDLKVLLEDWDCSLDEQSSGNVYAVYKSSHYPNPLIRLFLDYLVEKTRDKSLLRTAV